MSGLLLKLSTDNESYSRFDSGCKDATEYLGHQSSCFTCPFRDCRYGEGGVGLTKMLMNQRNEHILKKYTAGSSIRDLANEFGINIRTIQRVLVGKK